MDSFSLLEELDHLKNSALASCCIIWDGAGLPAAAFQGPKTAANLCPLCAMATIESPEWKGQYLLAHQSSLLWVISAC